MNLRDVTAALKAVYRPVFRGGIERELRAHSLLAAEARETADEFSTGAGRAIASLTQGKGE